MCDLLTYMSVHQFHAVPAEAIRASESLQLELYTIIAAMWVLRAKPRVLNKSNKCFSPLSHFSSPANWSFKEGCMIMLSMAEGKTIQAGG